MIKFTSPLPPSANEYLGKSVAYSGCKPYVHIYKTQKAKAYESHMVKTLRRVSKEQEWKIPEKNEYIIMELTYYMNKLGRDIDNTYKLLIDALANAGMIINDDKVIPIPVDIFIDSENPRIEVTLKVSDKIGVFKNEKLYENFLTENCFQCKRYTRNCTLLKKLKENRIIPEVNLKENKCYKKR